LTGAIKKYRAYHHGRQIKGGNLEVQQICEKFQVSNKAIKILEITRKKLYDEKAPIGINLEMQPEC